MENSKPTHPRRMEKRWEIAPKIPLEISNQMLDFPMLGRQLLYNRGCNDSASAFRFLKGTVDVSDPDLLTGMTQAVKRVLQAIDSHELVAVYGDYDVDGVTATALLTEVLRAYGGNVRAYIPNRFDEGYGVNIEALDLLAAEGVRLIITVDCGIRSLREAEHAREIGLELIITDHHHPQDEVPQALAVICPKQPDDAYPDKNLAGVGVAYKLVEALFAARPLDGRRPQEWLDLVALGTVADIVPLRGENRGLVIGGLRELRRGSRPGLASLARAAGVNLSKITGGDIGFMLGPRLNAAGRLESALQAYDLLVAPDLESAGLLAQKLDDQNRQRQALTSKLQQLAETLFSEEDLTGHLLFAAHRDFNSGVVGLVASRLAESYYRPAIVAQIGDEYTRASCRSIPEFHITAALDACSSLMEHHGGHAMAAGFTIRNEHIGELKRRLQDIAREQLQDVDLRPVLRADMEIQFSDLKPNEMFSNLDPLQPTGMGNPEAAFVARGLRVTQARQIGSDGSHLRLTLSDGWVSFDGVAFRQGYWITQLPARVDILFTYERNTYQGVERVQLNIKDIKASQV